LRNLARFGKNHLPLGEFIFDGPLGILGDLSPVPIEITGALGKLFYGDWLLLCGFEDSFLFGLTPVAIGLCAGYRGLEPALGVRGDRDEVSHPGNLFHGLDEIGARSVDAISKDILERHLSVFSDILEHLHSKLGLGPKFLSPRDVAFLPFLSIVFGEPFSGM